MAIESYYCGIDSWKTADYDLGQERHVTSPLFRGGERRTDGHVISIISERKSRTFADIGTHDGALKSTSVDDMFIHVLMSISSWFSF